MRDDRASGDKRTQPIMIAGCGRSGTSLLRTLVDAHPDVAIPSESLFVIDYLKYEHILPAQVATWMLHREPQLLCWHEQGVMSRSTPLEELRLIHQKYAERHDAKVWGQKTPRFIRYIEMIDRKLGPCNWLLIHRDPRAVVASMKKSGQHPSNLVLACKRWKRDNAPIIETLQSPHPTEARIKIVKYEQLTAHPEAVVSDIFDFLKLQNVPLKNLIDKAKPVFFSRSAFKVNTIRHGVIPDAAYNEAWRTNLESWEIAFIQDRCSTEMKVLRYSLLSDGSCRIRLAPFAFDAFKDLLIPLRYIRYWPEYILYTLFRKAAITFFRVLRLFK